MFRDFLMVILTEGYIQITHTLIVKHLYCKWKKQKNHKRKCYYWNCNKYKECEYNTNDKRNLKESLIIGLCTLAICVPLTIITYFILY